MRGSRKGYFFIIDAVIASMVLFAGLFVIFSGAFTTQDTLQPLVALEDIVTTMAITSVSSSVNEYYITELLPAGLVLFPDATPIEQITYLLQKDCSPMNCTSHAENYTRSLFESSVDRQYGVQLTIDGRVVQRYGPANQRYVLARSIVIYARNETGVIGPLIGEVQLWG